MHAENHENVQITPIPLNTGEADFVACLKDVVENNTLDGLHGKKIFLMRNESGCKGISFFNDYKFYPDFILWIKDSKRQDILFIDPKGLVRYDDKMRSKVALHTEIKKTEAKIHEKNPEIALHSYIWSNTKPQNIGTDTKMTLDKCHEKGIYIAKPRGDLELMKLLRHALQNP